jgi:hypothetical protein
MPITISEVVNPDKSARLLPGLWRFNPSADQASHIENTMHQGCIFTMYTECGSKQIVKYIYKGIFGFDSNDDI